MTDSEMTAQLGRLLDKLKLAARQYLPHDEADDAAQDVSLRLWQMRAELLCPIDALAHVMVRNECIDRLRRRRTSVPLEQAAGRQDTDDGAQREQMERMMQIVQSLPAMPQTVLRLRHMQGLETERIAALLGTTPAAVRMALSRARRLVRERYEIEQKTNND